MKAVLRIIQLIFTFIALGVASFAVYKLLKTGILPAKYVWVGIVVLAVLFIGFVASGIIKKTLVAVRIIVILLEIGVSVGALIGLNYLNKGTEFVGKITVVEDIPEKTLAVTEKPFTVFIGGVDSTDKLNDVNMIMVVNPKQGKVLLVGIPRDYYVPFHNTGVKDKLTHSAEWMGADINNTIATIRDFMNIELDYYIRLDFAAIVKLVDTIGGIDIYSDKPFRSANMPDCYFEQGMNHVDGRHALAFTRERRSYEGQGDLHRIENQAVVMEAIIAKLSDHNTFVKYYQDLLDTSAEVLKTNFREEDIYSFVNYILDNSPKWQVERYRLSGTHIYNVISPYNNNQPNTMIDPDWSTVEIARTKIEALLSE